ncbi:MAG: PocR ligand-binding domain-containing protein [Lachnospiraceae bacterium]|jgi:AraC-like DNA-binding protein|nr:PocR ligand-binding domain-containing protein [Lachnospiraceae bacterium]
MFDNKKDITSWLEIQKDLEQAFKVHIMLMNHITGERYQTSDKNTFCHHLTYDIKYEPCTLCLQNFEENANWRNGIPYLQRTCPFGIHHIIFPIMLENFCVATLHVGHFKTSSIDTKHMQENYHTLINYNDFQNLYNELPSLSRENIRTIFTTIKHLSGFILPKLFELEFLKAKETFEIEEHNTHENKDLFQKIDFLLRINHDKIYSLKDIASKAHYSTSRISRLIKKNTGKTFSYYYDDIKIHQAKEYLINTNNNTCDIAKELGYTTSALYKKFKKATGYTMSDFRDKFANNSLFTR